MKTLKLLTSAILLTVSTVISAQTINSPKIKVAVLGIDVRDMPKTSESLAHLTRLQLQKNESFSVFRQYDVDEELKEAKEDANNCFSIKCLSRIGKLIGAEQMLTGSIESFGDRIIINYSLIDVQNQEIVKSVVNEFYYFPNQLEGMIEICLNELMNIPNDPKLIAALEKQQNIIQEHAVEKLRLNGPRMGALYVGGHKGERMKKNRENGGYDMLPIMSQFGYQFEKQYMSAGNVQALLEFLPMVCGMDQGRFVPSFTFMNGFRHSRSGWEFAFGPTISFKKVAEGYFDENNQWNLAKNYQAFDENGQYIPNPYKIVEDYDSRGSIKFSYGFTLAAGKTFTSGQLNIPLNVFFTPAKDGFHIGASFGFNVRKKTEY